MLICIKSANTEDCEGHLQITSKFVDIFVWLVLSDHFEVIGHNKKQQQSLYPFNLNKNDSCDNYT